MLTFALHIPDGFLPLSFSLVGWAAAILLLIPALKGSTHHESRMGLLAACVLAAQTLQFPIPGGTSAHLQGSALAALLLGPWNGLLVLTCVIAVQGLVLGDGGLLVMGWNLVNMGVIGGLGACALQRLALACRCTRTVANGLAAWGSVQLSTLAVCLELSAAGTSPLSLSLPAMLTVQALVGLGEAAATVGAIRLYESRA